MTRDGPVDAVITWVDGTDQAFAQKLTDYLSAHHIDRRGAAAPTRFNSCGEIDYCLRSLFHFAPWIRTIHVVTYGQTPSFLSTLRGTVYEDKIKLVDHRDIFKGFEQYLPTFNSLTIESMLWRIPDLAEQFIYFNDDCALIQPMEAIDFFRQGRPVLRGHWKTHTEKKWRASWRRAYAFVRQRPYQPMERHEHRAIQERSAQVAGFKRYFFHVPHVPSPLIKQTFVDFFHQHPAMLEQNIRYAFRDAAQFMPVSLAYHVDIKRKRVVFDWTLKGVTLHATHHSAHHISKRLARADRNHRVSFICMQSVDEGTPATRERLLHWLDKRIPKLD